MSRTKEDVLFQVELGMKYSFVNDYEIKEKEDDVVKVEMRKGEYRKSHFSQLTNLLQAKYRIADYFEEIANNFYNDITKKRR